MLKRNIIHFTYLALLLLAACAPAPTSTLAPTQPLIPPTATLPQPDTLPATATLELLIPADAQALVSDALTDLAAALDTTAPAIDVLGVEPVVWTDAALGCVSDIGTDTQAGYRILLRTDDIVHEYHAADGEVRRCDYAADATEAASADPLAAELTLMAQQRVAEELDLSTRRVRVVSVEPMIWTDTGLNCPTPDTVYEPAQIAGYRFVLAAGDQQFIFHSDFDRLIACTPEQETTPEAQ